MLPLAAGTFIAGIAFGVADGWASINSVTMFGAAVLAAIGIPLGLRGTDEPLLHLELFKDRTFSWAMVLSLLIVTVMFGSMLLIPLYLQEVHGYNALQTGLLLLPQAVTAAFAMPLGGMLTDRIGPRPVVVGGMILLAVGSVLLAQIQVDSPISLVVGALLLRGFAMGFSMMPTMSAALARVPRQYTSRASSITNSLQRIGSSVGIAVLVTILVAQFAGAASSTACNPSAALSTSTHHTVTASQVCGQLKGEFSNVQFQGSSTSQAKTTGVAAVDTFTKRYADNVLSTSFDRVFAFTAILSIIGVIPALFLRKPEKSSTDQAALAAA